MTPALASRIGSGAIAAALTIVGPVVSAGADGPAGAAPPSGSGLTRFSSCDALRQWYVDHTIDQVGAYGWANQVFYAMGADAPMSTRTLGSDSAGALPGVTNSATGTNTQQAGIDEPDVAKTDGRLVVRLQGREVVVTDVSGPAPRELSTWALPPQTYADGLLLVDSHVLLTGEHGRTHVEGSLVGGYDGADTTDLYDLDLSVPTSPRLAAHTTWSGATLSLRQYGDTVRLVTSSSLPDLAFVVPGKGLSASQATAHNREVVRSSTIEQWLPSVRAGGGTSHRAVDCGRIYRPDLLVGAARDTATIGVFTLHPGDTAPRSAAAVIGRGSQVYSSSDRLYVWDTLWNVPTLHPGLADRPMIRPLAQPHTDVHAFALDGDQTNYVGSGSIDGQVRDSWSFDEHDGHLRVAVTWPHRLVPGVPRDPITSEQPDASTSDNGVVVLDEQGGRLEEVGRLRGLGSDEQIQSVRWFDDLAVLVTFRQTDPLFTVDLTDPEHPRALGELHLPGYSSYLHPIGEGRLLGLGTAGTVDGRTVGAKAAVFDLTDPVHVHQLGEVALGNGSWLTAAEDPHTFTWAPSGTSGSDGTGTAVTQLVQASGSTTLVALEVDRDGEVTSHELPPVGGGDQRALPLPGGRLALVGTRVVVVAAS
jgi:uncharacterized secreted protein with C-terminal beta-propeller domain